MLRALKMFLRAIELQQGFLHNILGICPVFQVAVCQPEHGVGVPFHRRFKCSVCQHASPRFVSGLKGLSMENIPERAEISHGPLCFLFFALHDLITEAAETSLKNHTATKHGTF